MVGGARPVKVHVPAAYKPGTPMPLVLLLHGYSVNGAIQDIYLGITKLSDARGFLYAHPDGTIDSKGNHFWNATDGCCDFDGSNVDDSAYLSGLIAEIEGKLTVDPKRVFLIGHSNGGFMSHRMACDHADQIAAIVSLAGAMWLDSSKCKPTRPVSVLQVHGTKDSEVLYDGLPGGGGGTPQGYPGAATSVADWATNDGCSATLDTSAPNLDVDSSIPGAETTVGRHLACKPGGAAELWSIEGGSHVPSVSDDSRAMLIDWLLAHPRP